MCDNNLRWKLTLPVFCSLGGSNDYASELLTHPSVVAVAKRINKVPAQVLLKWSIVERSGHGHGHNHRRAAVTSGVNAAYGVEDLALWGWDLSAEDIASLDTIDIAPDDPVKGMCVL